MKTHTSKIMMEQQQQQEQDQDKNNNHGSNFRYYNDENNATRIRSNSLGSLGDRSNWDAEEGKYNIKIFLKTKSK